MGVADTMFMMPAAFSRCVPTMPVLMIWIVACTPTTSRLDHYQLALLQPDCVNAEAQITYLESQVARSGIPSILERLRSVDLLSPVRPQASAETTAGESKSYESLRYEAKAKSIIWQLRTYCD